MKNRRSKKRKMGFRSRLSSGFHRGTTLMSAKHDEGMLMSVDSLVFGTSKEVRSYEEPNKIRKIGTADFKYMLYGGCGVSLTIDMVFNGLMELATKLDKERTVLTAQKGIKLARRMLALSYRNFVENIKLEDDIAYTSVMLASHESKGAEADGKEGQHEDEEDDEAPFKFDGGSDSEEGSDKNEEDIEDTDDEDSGDEDANEEEDNVAPLKFDRGSEGEEGSDMDDQDSGDEDEMEEESEDKEEEKDGNEEDSDENKKERRHENEEDDEVPFKFDVGSEGEQGSNKNEEDIEDMDDEDSEDEDKEEEENEDDEEGGDGNIEDGEEEESEDDVDEGESGDEEGRDEVPKAELQSENKEEQKVGPRKLFLSTIRSVDKYKRFRKFYAHMVVEDEVKDDVPVPPAVEFNPAEFFSSGDFQANSMAGLYGADHETCYSIPKLSVKGAGMEEGLKHLNRYLKKDSNLDAEALTVFQDAMVDACATGESGGTIRVYCIEKQNNIRDLASDTLSKLQQAKAGRFPRGLKRTLSELQQAASRFPRGYKRCRGT